MPLIHLIFKSLPQQRRNSKTESNQQARDETCRDSFCQIHPPLPTSPAQSHVCREVPLCWCKRKTTLKRVFKLQLLGLTCTGRHERSKTPGKISVLGKGGLLTIKTKELLSPCSPLALHHSGG